MAMGLGTRLPIVLILLLIGAFPAWPLPVPGRRTRALPGKAPACAVRLAVASRENRVLRGLNGSTRWAAYNSRHAKRLSTDLCGASGMRAAQMPASASLDGAACRRCRPGPT
jgi:hypothetical protein